MISSSQRFQRTINIVNTTAGKNSSRYLSYHNNVIQHFENPKNVGSMSPNDPNVGIAIVGAPACGDVMKLCIRIDPESKQVIDAKFKTFGCGSAIASSSLATELSIGQHVDALKNITNKEIASHLSLPPVKLHCSMLAEDALKMATKNWKEKQNKKQL